MTALSAERAKTLQIGLGPVPTIVSYRVKGTTKIYKGSLVALNGGYAAPGATATGRIAVGRAEETVDNTSGSDGDKRVKVSQGCFAWDNATSTDACTAADIGSDVYMVDDHTITHTSTGASKAGKLVDILSTGQVVVLTGLGVV